MSGKHVPDPTTFDSVDDVRALRDRIVSGELAGYDDDYLLSETMAPALTYLLNEIERLRKGAT